jgi:hypothetical protein
VSLHLTPSPGSRLWWAAEITRASTDWSAVVTASIGMMTMAGIIVEPAESAVADARNSPSWRQAALDYHKDRPRGPAIEPDRLRRLRRLLKDDYSLDGCWHELRDMRPKGIANGG